MALTPTFALEGSTDYATRVSTVTSVRDQILQGVLAEAVVDVQVRINGGPFRSDTTLVSFDQTSFTVPNLTALPQGLRLNFGRNTIEVRTIDITGAASAPAVATFDVVREEDLDLTVAAPTGLRVRRKSGSIELVWAENLEPEVLGYHVYASSVSGGGDAGYVRLNGSMITEVSFSEDTLVDVESATVSYTTQGGQLGIQLQDLDFDDQVISEVGNFALDTSLAAGTLRLTTDLKQVQTINYVAFTHDRDATEDDGILNNETFALVPDDEPLFYVITAVARDPATGQQVESVYSAELVGLPLIIDTQLREITPRTRDNIVRDYIRTIVRSNTQISAIPGSTTRDIHLDPNSAEMERLHFLLDFTRRSQSFATLIAVDDLDGDGETDAVADNPYKQALQAALGLEDEASVQLLIDASFDKLANNAQKTRLGALRSVGQAVFFTTREPTTDRVVEVGTLLSTQGSPTISFQTTARAVLPFADRDSYYNLQLRRWEITVPIQSVATGLVTNVAAGQITTVIGTGTSLQVTNTEATRFGQDRESNLSLAERSILAFSSVDAGTAGGYLATALKQVGVFRAKVIKAGHPLMMRDYDPVRDKHIGGKVDVYVQGDDLIQVTDRFALTFDVARDIQFFLDSNPSDLIFVVNDPRITPTTPITDLLGTTALEISQGFGFRNATTGQDFDLTGAVILDYNQIQLDNSIAQPAVNANDVILGDVRFQSSTSYALSRQPVFGLTSVRSTTNNVVLTEGTTYNLVQLQDPLLEGFSTRAMDLLEITPVGGVPSGDQTMINDERLVLVGQTPTPVANLGANPLTVRVFDLTRTIEYNGPNTASPDFLIEPGDEITALRISRVPTGSITNGQEVSVDYLHDENFEVIYTVNNLPHRVQDAIDIQSHATADVLVKSALGNELDLEMTVVLNSGASQAQVDAALRTNLSQLLNSKGIGEPIYQSDVVRVIENTSGVNYVVVPFARMTLADGSLLVREPVNSASVFLNQQGNVKVYLLSDALDFPTQDGAGPSTQPVGAFEDGQPMTLVATYNELFTSSNRVVVIGNAGRNIQGYSDDVTLTAQGFNTAEEREAQRQALTQNRLLVSLPDGETPDEHSYAATYTVQGDKSARSLIPGEVSFVELGQLSITYR